MAGGGMKNQEIEKIYFMVHPVCYSKPVEEMIKGRTSPEREQVIWFCERERAVRVKQDELIRNLKKNEALVLYPIGLSERWPAMLNLEKLVRNIPDKRGIILPEKLPGPRNMDEWQKVSEDIRIQITDEIVRMYDVYWYDWQATEIKVIVYSSLYADCIKKGFQDA